MIKKTVYKMGYFYILRTFLIVTILLLEIGSICYYCIKYRSNEETYSVHSISGTSMGPKKVVPLVKYSTYQIYG